MIKNNKMKKIKLVIFLFTCILGTAFSQDNVYYTRNANLQIHGEFDGKSLHGKTKQLGITLDYETTEIILKLNLNDLEFDVDSLNQILENNFSEIEFKGKLSLEYINTDDHPPQKFKVEGWVEVDNEKKEIEGNGELHHIDQADNIACMLGMTIILNLEDFNIIIPKLENEIGLVIQQALLKQDKN